jgi:hypothetical protein
MLRRLDALRVWQSYCAYDGMGASSFALPADGRNQALISSQPVPFVLKPMFFSLRNRLERLLFSRLSKQ